MSTSTARSPDHPPIYRDPKRHAWLLSLWVPLSIGAGPLMWTVHPSHWVLWVPTIFVYLVAPLLDLLLGTDTGNPPETAVPALEADPYYRRVTYALVPLLWLGFIFAAWFSQQPGLSSSDRVALVLATGAPGAGMGAGVDALLDELRPGLHDELLRPCDGERSGERARRLDHVRRFPEPGEPVRPRPRDEHLPDRRRGRDRLPGRLAPDDRHHERRHHLHGHCP